MISISYIGAFVAGILSFLSPCILPLLPGYLSIITGVTLGDDVSGQNRNAVGKGLLGAFFFGLGFTTIFIILGATATTLGRVLYTYQPIIVKVLGVAVVILGLNMLGVLKLSFLYKQAKFDVKVTKTPTVRHFQSFLMGLAFAFGWTPCVGPILGGILTLASQQESVSDGVLLLTAYSLGLWIPFMLAALFTVPILKQLSKYRNLTLRANQLAGVLLIVMGVLLFTGELTRIAAMLSV